MGNQKFIPFVLLSYSQFKFPRFFIVMEDLSRLSINSFLKRNDTYSVEITSAFGDIFKNSTQKISSNGVPLMNACALVMTTERNQLGITRETPRALHVLFCLKASWICWNMQINLMKIQQKVLSRFSASHSNIQRFQE